jgi:hypothetical protein
MRAFQVQFLNKAGEVYHMRFCRDWSAQFWIDKVGIDNLRFRLLAGPDKYFHPEVFGFKSTRIRKNSAIAAARLRNTFCRKAPRPDFGSDLTLE